MIKRMLVPKNCLATRFAQGYKRTVRCCLFFDKTAVRGLFCLYGADHARHCHAQTICFSEDVSLKRSARVLGADLVQPLLRSAEG
ncbi:hypothetical protein Hanom_Chr09g00832111 [Helianthus anomalus]